MCELFCIMPLGGGTLRTCFGASIATEGLVRKGTGLDASNKSFEGYVEGLEVSTGLEETCLSPS